MVIAGRAERLTREVVIGGVHQRAAPKIQAIFRPTLDRQANDADDDRQHRKAKGQVAFGEKVDIGRFEQLSPTAANAEVRHSRTPPELYFKNGPRDKDRGEQVGDESYD